MLFGRIIVVKRDGQDGSVYPVTTEKTLIGRSKECNIHVQLPNIDDVHCAILIKENREPYIHNMSGSRPLHLNGRILNPSEMKKLKSSDIFVIGERTFRYIVVTQVRRPSILKKVSFTTSKIELENSATHREMQQKIVYSSPQLVSTSKFVPAPSVVKHISSTSDMRSNAKVKNVNSTVAVTPKAPLQSEVVPTAAMKLPSSTGRFVSHVTCYRPLALSKTASKILAKASRRVHVDVKSSSPALSKQRVRSPTKCVSTVNRKIDPMSNLRRKLKRSSVVSTFKGRTPPQSTSKIPVPKSPDEIPGKQANVAVETSPCTKPDSSSLLSLKLTPSEKTSKATPSSSLKQKRGNSISLRDLKITPSSKVIISENTPTLDFADHSISLPLSEKSVKITPARDRSISLQDSRFTPSGNSLKTTENSTPSLIGTPKFSAENVKQEKINSLRRSRSTSSKLVSSATVTSTKKRLSSKSAVPKLELNDENKRSISLQDLNLTQSRNSLKTPENSTPSLIMTPKFSTENVKQDKINTQRRSRSTSSKISSSTMATSAAKRRNSKSTFSKLDLSCENKSSTILQDLKSTPGGNGLKSSESSTPSLVVVTPQFSAGKQEKLNSLKRSASTSSKTATTASVAKLRNSKSTISKLDLNDGENDGFDSDAAFGSMPSLTDKHDQIETHSCIIFREDLEKAAITPKLNDTVEKLCEDLCHTVTEQIKRSLAQNFPILERESDENNENVDRSTITLTEIPSATEVQILPMAEILENKPSTNEKSEQTKVRFFNLKVNENSKPISSPITPGSGDFSPQSSGTKWKNVRKTPIRKAKSKIQPSTPDLGGLFDTPEATADRKIENPFVLQLSCRITTEDKEIFHKSFMAQSVNVAQPQTIDVTDQPSPALEQNIETCVSFQKVETPTNENKILSKKANELTNPEIMKPSDDQMSMDSMAQGDHDVTHGSELSSIRRSSRLATREKAFTPKTVEVKSTPVRRTRRALATVAELPVDTATVIVEESNGTTEEKPKTRIRATKKDAKIHRTEKHNQDADSTKIEGIPIESAADTVGDLTTKFEGKLTTEARITKNNIKSQTTVRQIESGDDTKVKGIPVKSAPLLAEELPTKFAAKLTNRVRITKKNIKGQTDEKQIANGDNAEVEGIREESAASMVENLAIKFEGKSKTRARSTKKNTENSIGHENNLELEERPVESTALIAEDLTTKSEGKLKTRARVTKKNAKCHTTEENVVIEDDKKLEEIFMLPPTVPENEGKVTSTRTTRKRAQTAENIVQIIKTADVQRSTASSETVTIEVLEQPSVKPKRSRKTVKSTEEQNELTKVVQKIEEPLVEKRTLRSSTRNQKK